MANERPDAMNGQKGKQQQPTGVRIVGFCAALAALAALVLAVPHSSLALDVIYYVGVIAATIAVIFTFYWLIEPSPLARVVVLVLAALAFAAALGWFAGGALSSPHLSGSRTYAQRLRVSFNQLAKSRELAYREIERTRKPGDQAHQLRLLSRAFVTDALSLRKFRVSPAAGSLPGRLASGLASVSVAYSKLAAAITAPGATKVKLWRARRRLRASEDKLHASEAKLGAHGYVVEFRLLSKNG